MKIPIEYFQNIDVLALAEDLIGKYVFTRIEGQLAGGYIVETEAYKGVNDRASHAFGGKKTKRNASMFEKGGIAYIYLCYGVHYLFNIVTGDYNIPDAVLIRAIVPTHGEELILKRRGKYQIDAQITNGPGKVSQALGINKEYNGCSLIASSHIWLENRQLYIDKSKISKIPRVGVDYAGEDAFLPYRFLYGF